VIKRGILVLTASFLLAVFPASASPTFITAVVTQAMTDGSAMVFTVEAVNQTDTPTLYGTLDTVYVNGQEARVVKTSALTYAFLDNPHVFTVTVDISALPEAASWTAAATYTVLKPRGQVVIIDDTITDDIESFNEQVTLLNEQGRVVATQKGDILLAQGTYNEDWLISGRLEVSGKMAPMQVVPLVFTLELGDMDILKGSGTADMGGWSLRVRKAHASAMSCAVVIEELFPETYTLGQVLEEQRYFRVSDQDGGRDFFQGDNAQLSDPVRTEDGSWLVQFNWSTQGVLLLPAAFRLTPYTFNAAMSPVLESDRMVEITLRQ